MASRILRVCNVFTTYVRSTSVTHNVSSNSLLKRQVLLVQNARNCTNFFNKRPASQLWKSVTSVSNAGRRRGRAKGAPKMKDLNKGQKLGQGKIAMIFPGLNAPITKGDFVLKQRQLTPQEQQEVKTAQETAIVFQNKRRKVHPLKRGWTGGFPGGRKCGAPDPVDGEAFEGFESWILHVTQATVMSSNMGRKRCCRTMVITGNGNGMAGFSVAEAKDLKTTVITAKNKAGQRLMYIERYNDHTVLHDFFTQFGRTKIFVYQKHKGYGLKCHRVIRTCCEAIGIKDLYAKVEGSTNAQCIVKAFFMGLLQQKTHEQMANEKKMHLVEMKKENNYFPTVLASPSTVRTSSEIPSDETLDFNLYVLNGRVPLKRKPRPPPFEGLPSWLVHLRRAERHRGQNEVVLRLRAEYGEVCSFLTEKYPEARPPKYRNHKKEKEDAEKASL